jgi:hypothetical protein
MNVMPGFGENIYLTGLLQMWYSWSLQYETVIDSCSTPFNMLV